PTDSTTFPFRSSDWVTRAGADARANVRVSPGAVVTAGAALERESMRGTTLDTSRARLGGAVYGQVVLTGRPLDATLGARLDDNERFGRFATYRAGAAWRLAGGARAVAYLGTGFKEPSFYQNFATGFVRGNPDLRPEHTFSWEAGLEWTSRDRRAALGERYFDQRFLDLIDYNGADTVTNYFNVPGANARGVELTGDAAPAAGLQLALAYTLLRTRVTAGGADTSATALYRPGQSLLRRPRQAGRLTIAYRPPAGAARAGVAVAVAYTGARADVDYRTFQRVTLPGYTRVDVAADVTPRAPHDGLPGLTLRARIENVFDRAYEEIKNFPARRRTLLFGGEVRFGPCRERRPGRRARQPRQPAARGPGGARLGRPPGARPCGAPGDGGYAEPAGHAGRGGGAGRLDRLGRAARPRGGGARQLPRWYRRDGRGRRRAGGGRRHGGPGLRRQPRGGHRAQLAERARPGRRRGARLDS